MYRQVIFLKIIIYFNFMHKPHFKLIKNTLIDKIQSSELLPLQKIPSENTLVKTFSVSRMTVRRALDELVNEKILYRIQGLGTFVSDTKTISATLEIKNIADEINAQGNTHSINIISLNQQVASDELARILALQVNDSLFYSSMIHYDNGIPIQYEERWVNPHSAPEYLKQDFTRTTPTAYLMEVAPLEKADHVIQAILADEKISSALAIDRGSPCLKISRKTYSDKKITSFSFLIHPGEKYQLSSHLHF